MPPKTSGFWISFRSISMRRKKVPQGIGHGPALAAADVAGRESWRFCRSSDYQIAHLPPAAASAGAACWAAKYKKYALLRSVFCRTACQHAAAKPINRRVSARCVGAAAGMGVQAIRCGTFLYRGWNRTREIQKPLVFGGVLFHISFAVERNMAAGGIEKKVVGPLRPKVTRARSAEYSRRRERSERRRWRIQRGERVAAVKISSARRQAAQKFRAPQQRSFSNINRAAGPYGVRLSGCAGKCGRGAGRKKRDQPSIERGTR